MATEKKIVEFNALKRSQTQVSALPMPLMKLKTAFAKKLTQLCAAVFQSADDILFQRADKAFDGEEQSAYFNAMRELRLGKKAIEIAFEQSIHQSFSDMSRSAHDEGANPSDAGGLSLLEQNMLERNVAVDSMINKAIEINADELGHLILRFQCVSNGVDVSMGSLPIGPRKIVTGFADALSDINIDIKAQLVVLKLFDKFVVSQLGKFYEAANNALVKQGVMPDLKRNEKLQKKKAPDGGSSDTGQSKESKVMFSMLQKAIRTRDGSGIVSKIPVAGESGGSANVVESPQILDALSKAQLNQALNPPSIVLGEAQNEEYSKEKVLLDFTKVIRDIMQPSQPQAYNQVNADVIGLVSMLFEYVLDDPQIPEKMRILIARLQIPMLKTAIVDKSFFDVGGHPARRLLNEISRATIGWEERKNNARDHLFEKIETVIQRVLVEFDTNVSVFVEALEEFQAFMDVDKRRSDLIAKRIQDAEEGKARSEKAQKAVERLVRLAVRGKDIPEAVMPLIKDGWQRALLITYLKGGESHPKWSEQTRTLVELIWTIDPNTSGAEARKQFLRVMPRVLRDVREGLSEISFDLGLTNKLFAELERIHVKSLQKVSVLLGQEITAAPEQMAPVESVSALAESPVQEQPIAPEQEETVKALLKETFEGSDEDTHVSEPGIIIAPEVKAELDRFQVGAWFEYRDEQGGETRCKLAAMIKATGKYIYINRAGAKVLDLMEKDVIELLQARRMLMLDDGQIFDRALENIIGSMRA